MNFRYYLQRILLQLLGRKRIVVDNLPWGDRFVLNLERAVDRQIYLRRFEPMETKIVSAMVDQGSVCVDVGANIGYYTSLMANCVGDDGYVIAFEPGRQIQPWLTVNLDINKRGDRVIVLGKAASNAESNVVFYECEDAAYSSTLVGATDYETERRRYNVETVRLDATVGELGFMDKVSLIKVDVEGGEALVIAGAEQLIARSKPVLIVEYFHLGLRGQSGNKSEFIRHLIDFGYRGFFLNKKQAKVEEFDQPYFEGNLIFIHSTKAEKIDELKRLNLYGDQD